MKTLSIGDIHGRDIWKKIIEDNSWNKVIFVGDYCDSWDKENQEIIQNLYDIIEFKKENKDNVILLLGNHDVHYIYGYDKYGASGYRPAYADIIKDIFTINKDLFQFSYQIDNILWTHAGVSNGWYYKCFEKLHLIDKYRSLDFEESMTLSDKLNYLFDNQISILFNVGYERGGMNRYGGPLWADKAEFTSRGASLKNYIQIAGHNPVNEITTHTVNNDRSITFIDCLEHRAKGYLLDI